MLLTENDDVVSLVGAAIEDALRDPSYVATHPAHAERLRLGLVDPDCVLLVDCASAQVRLGHRREPGVTGMVAMAGDTAVAVCRGQVDLAAAVASGEIVVDGAGSLLMELFVERRFAAAG